MPFSARTGVVTPSDFRLIHDVYSEITAEPWFTRSPERREQFALLVIDAFREGNVEHASLHDHCRRIAVGTFGNGAAAIH